MYKVVMWLYKWCEKWIVDNGGISDRQAAFDEGLLIGYEKGFKDCRAFVKGIWGDEKGRTE